jgi:hypothetical protein
MGSSLSFAEAREAVIATLERAADTLRRLPMPIHARPAPVQSSWPSGPLEPLRAHDASAGSAAIRAPTARSISELDRVLPWLSNLDVADRRLVWARACGLSWPRLARKFGISIGQVRYRWNGAIDRVVATAVHDPVRRGRQIPLEGLANSSVLGVDAAEAYATEE